MDDYQWLAFWLFRQEEDITRQKNEESVMYLEQKSIEFASLLSLDRAKYNKLCEFAIRELKFLIRYDLWERAHKRLEYYQDIFKSADYFLTNPSLIMCQYQVLKVTQRETAKSMIQSLMDMPMRDKLHKTWKQQSILAYIRIRISILLYKNSTEEGTKLKKN